MRFSPAQTHAPAIGLLELELDPRAVPVRAGVEPAAVEPAGIEPCVAAPVPEPTRASGVGAGAH